MLTTVLWSLILLIAPAIGGMSESAAIWTIAVTAATEASAPAAATPEVAAGTGTVESRQVLRDPNLVKLLWMYTRLSPEERGHFLGELRKPEVREEISQILQNPQRLATIRDERPELYKRFERHRELRQSYWELLKEYHESTDRGKRAELEKKIREGLIELVDTETARFREELEMLKQRISWLEQRLDERLTHRSELIQRQLEQDLKHLPPPPRFGPGPEERGPGVGPRRSRGGPDDRDDVFVPPWLAPGPDERAPGRGARESRSPGNRADQSTASKETRRQR